MKRTEQRAARRARALSRVKQGFQPQAIADPIAHPMETGRRWLLKFALLLFALAAHAAVLGLFFVGSSLAATLAPAPPKPKPLAVEIRTVPPPEPEAEPPPQPEPEPEPEAKPAPKPQPKPKRRPKRRPKPEPEAVPPPADPIDAPPEPKKNKKVRRIVGLSLGSTVKGGGGPSFAVGNTRMGRTGHTAEDPKAAKKLAPEAAPTTKQNRVATRIPTKQKTIKPKILKRAVPSYPAQLKAQGVEAQLTVAVIVGANGKVKKAWVVKSSGYPAFDAAALAAARKTRWAPAKRGGKAVDYQLSFQTRFRLDN